MIDNICIDIVTTNIFVQFLLNLTSWSLVTKQTKSKLMVDKGGIMDQVCDRFKPSIPKGIALNESLKENLFLLFICIQNKTSLSFVGKPTSSKTLAMSIMRNYSSDHNRDELNEDGY